MTTHKYQPLYLKFADEAEFDAICRDADGNLLPWIHWTNPPEHVVMHNTGSLDAEGQPILERADGFHTGGWVEDRDKGNLPTLAQWTVTPDSPQVLLL